VIETENVPVPSVLALASVGLTVLVPAGWSAWGEMTTSATPPGSTPTALRLTVTKRFARTVPSSSISLPVSVALVPAPNWAAVRDVQVTLPSPVFRSLVAFLSPALRPGVASLSTNTVSE
jgi:hypothetical protein